MADSELQHVGRFRGHFHIIFSLAVLILSPVVAFECVEWYTHNPWEIMTTPVALLNIFFYEMIYLLLFFITGRARIACLLGDLGFFVFGLTNYYVVQFRSAPIVPWDIFSLGTAASVAKDYSYAMTLQAGVCTALFAVLIVLACFAGALRVRKASLRVSLAFIILGCLGWYTHLLHQPYFTKAFKLDNTLFTPYYMSRKNGLTTTFVMDIKFLRISQPSEYSKEEEEALLAQYPQETAAHKPNVIILMDEAFSDPAILGDFEVNQDYMPFVHSLQEKPSNNVITGTLNVSVKGGNTADTEWELLTGCTMRFLPGGSVPYQQYMFGDKPSVVSWLKKLGYSAVAIHPYNASGWNRDKVYGYFGFDTFLSNKDFPDASRIRKYIDDKSCFGKIIDLYEAKDPDEPLFVFAVTMQNHSGYYDDFDNFTVDVKATDCKSKILNRYLSLMKLSDEAFQDFTEYFSTAEEDTLIVFFGDHQPNDVVIEPIWKLQGKTSDTLTNEENRLRFKVPYVIWANFDLDGSGDAGETSVNYIASDILRAAGLPLSPYQQYVETLRENIPVISTKSRRAKDGHEIESAVDDLTGSLLAYRKIQYYHMFDEPRDP